ncbi:MAG: 30S ribosomal protein S7 [Anaerolineae bacterium]|nr:30S ribosomal protein S7 [Anaerolineae bacterium]MDW8099199.1 30S ribosomal protein S7 [Anaerolineae bacterium]
MPRRNRPPRRVIPPDWKYNSELVARLINKVMRNGKKSLAERIVYESLQLIEQRLQRPALEVLEQAVRNATPLLEVRPRRVGGATYQVPIEIPPDRRLSLALRWLVQYARQRPGKSMIEKLAAELVDAYQNQGATIKRREDTHRMAEANRAFAHYRW